ncbi:MAG TPA: GIY-YIG nuclease family protein [Bacteroidota bacterium]
MRSLNDGTFYYGSSADIPGRLKQHNAGKIRYPKGHRLYELHYQEEFATRVNAVVRVKFFKSIAGRR